MSSISVGHLQQGMTDPYQPMGIIGVAMLLSWLVVPVSQAFGS